MRAVIGAQGTVFNVFELLFRIDSQTKINFNELEIQITIIFILFFDHCDLQNFYHYAVRHYFIRLDQSTKLR